MDNTVIKSVGYDQHEIIRDILNLYCEGKSVDCDMTYSIGNFYGDFTEKVTVKNEDGTTSVENVNYRLDPPRYKFDVCPLSDDVVKIEPDGPLPLDDGSIGILVCDLPFVISVGPSLDTPDVDENGNRATNNMISRRFACYYPVAELLSSYKHWIEEISRVLKANGVAIFKCQDVVTGGKNLCSTYWSWLCGQANGLELVDSFRLIAKQRLISGKVKSQQHARRYDSAFLVFRKTPNKNIRYFDFMEEDELNMFIDGLKKTWLSKKKKNIQDR